MPTAEPRTILLANARPSDFWREFARRANVRLASLPDGREWTRMDVVFAGVVALLAVSSTGFFTTAYRIWSNDPDYFSNRLIANMKQIHSIDMIETGTVATPAAAGGTAAEAGALPVPRVVRAREPSPADYEIVMLFGEEALLATQKELMRARVGSVLPGLGRIFAIDEDGIRSEKATLRPAARP